RGGGDGRRGGERQHLLVLPGGRLRVGDGGVADGDGDARLAGRRRLLGHAEVDGRRFLRRIFRRLPVGDRRLRDLRRLRQFRAANRRRRRRQRLRRRRQGRKRRQAAANVELDQAGGEGCGEWRLRD